MHLERMKLLSTMLGEVIAGTWVPTTKVDLTSSEGDEQPREVFFDLAGWLSKDGGADGCGFSACAVGHAALDQRFNNHGLVFDGVTPTFFTRDGREETDWNAVEEFFDLTNDQASELFLNQGYDDEYPDEDFVTAEMVKKRVDEHIEAFQQQNPV